MPGVTDLSQTALPALTPSAFRIGNLIDNYSVYNNMYAAQPSATLSDYPYQQTLYRLLFFCLTFYFEIQNGGPSAVNKTMLAPRF